MFKTLCGLILACVGLSVFCVGSVEAKAVSTERETLKKEFVQSVLSRIEKQSSATTRPRREHVPEARSPETIEVTPELALGPEIKDRLGLGVRIDNNKVIVTGKLPVLCIDFYRFEITKTGGQANQVISLATHYTQEQIPTSCYHKNLSPGACTKSLRCVAIHPLVESRFSNELNLSDTHVANFELRWDDDSNSPPVSKSEKLSEQFLSKLARFELGVASCKDAKLIHEHSLHVADEQGLELDSKMKSTVDQWFCQNIDSVRSEISKATNRAELQRIETDISPFNQSTCIRERNEIRGLIADREIELERKGFKDLKAKVKKTSSKDKLDEIEADVVAAAEINTDEDSDEQKLLREFRKKQNTAHQSKIKTAKAADLPAAVADYEQFLSQNPDIDEEKGEQFIVRAVGSRFKTAKNLDDYEELDGILEDHAGADDYGEAKLVSLGAKLRFLSKGKDADPRAAIDEVVSDLDMLADSGTVSEFAVERVRNSLELQGAQMDAQGFASMATMNAQFMGPQNATMMAAQGIQQAFGDVVSNHYNNYMDACFNIGFNSGSWGPFSGYAWNQGATPTSMEDQIRCRTSQSALMQAQTAERNAILSARSMIYGQGYGQGIGNPGQIGFGNPGPGTFGGTGFGGGAMGGGFGNYGIGAAPGGPGAGLLPPPGASAGMMGSSPAGAMPGQLSQNYFPNFAI